MIKGVIMQATYD